MAQGRRSPQSYRDASRCCRSVRRRVRRAGVQLLVPPGRSGDKYEELAENNHQRTLALRAPRGVLYDRNLKVLVENRLSCTISIDRETHKGHRPDDPPVVGGRRPRSGAGAADRRTPPARAELPLHRHHRGRDLEQVAQVHARRLELPGVVIEKVPARKYPTDALAAHLFGYVGEASESAGGAAGSPRGRSSASRASS